MLFQDSFAFLLRIGHKTIIIKKALSAILKLLPNEPFIFNVRSAFGCLKTFLTILKAVSNNAFNSIN